MRASVHMAREAFAQLARRIAEIEGRPRPEHGTDRIGPPPPAGIPACPVPPRRFLPPRRSGAPLAFGVPELDRMLGGGLRRDALHEMRAGTTRDSPAATGFAVALLARLAGIDGRPVLLVIEEEAAREGGQPYGPGIDQFGLDPARLLVVATRGAKETLWVFEEALRCAGLAAVLCELRGHPKALDLTASRRLALRARESGVMGLLLRQAGAAAPSAATTRWHIAPRPAAAVDDFTEGIGRPAWRLDLERNRAGRTGRFDLEWDHGVLRFAVAGNDAAASLPVAGLALPGDRPGPSDAPGTVVAFRRTG